MGVEEVHLALTDLGNFFTFMKWGPTWCPALQKVSGKQKDRFLPG